MSCAAVVDNVHLSPPTPSVPPLNLLFISSFPSVLNPFPSSLFIPTFSPSFPPSYTSNCLIYQLPSCPLKPFLYSKHLLVFLLLFAFNFCTSCLLLYLSFFPLSLSLSILLYLYLFLFDVCLIPCPLFLFAFIPLFFLLFTTFTFCSFLSHTPSIPSLIPSLSSHCFYSSCSSSPLKSKEK